MCSKSALLVFDVGLRVHCLSFNLNISTDFDSVIFSGTEFDKLIAASLNALLIIIRAGSSLFSVIIPLLEQIGQGMCVKQDKKTQKVYLKMEIDFLSNYLDFRDERAYTYSIVLIITDNVAVSESLSYSSRFDFPFTV